MINSVYATITKDDGSGWYEAKTCLGDIARGVSLLGVDKKLTVNQRVSVWQVNGEFGAFSGSGAPSYLLLKDPAIAFQYAPAKTVLAYLAKKAGNLKRTLDIGTVTKTTPTVLVDGKNIGTGSIKATDLTVGDTLLCSVSNGKKTVLGWWACLPKSATKKTYAVFIYRPYFTAQLRCSLFSYNLLTGELLQERYQTFYPTLASSVECRGETWQTTDDSDYYYSIANMLDKNFALIERHYIKWDKVSLAPIELTSAQFYAEVPPKLAYNTTVDNKFWWPSSPSLYTCMQSDTIDGAKYQVFPGSFDNQGTWVPKKGWVYELI